jgi:hypothetical protein
LNSVLRQFPADRVRVFVVWEPILLTDLQPPSDRELGRVSDSRAAQFWDRNGTVSRAIHSPIVAGGQDSKRQHYRTSGEKLWDTVAIYPPGTLWGDGGPKPIYTGGPVVNVASDLRDSLRRAIVRQ